MRIFCRGFLQAGLVLKTRSSGRALVAIAVLCLCLFFAVGTPAQQETAGSDSSKPKYTEFEAPGAGTGALQGTLGLAMNTAGAIAGSYIDSSGVSHGFVRAANGTITEFNAPSAQGTLGLGINTAGVITGAYSDTSGVYHGFVRAANGTITSFDAPSAQGTAGISINTAGTIAGIYEDTSGGYHGFVRAAKGTITA